MVKPKAAKKPDKVENVYKPENWRYFRTLGSGSFGTVRKCISTEDRQMKEMENQEMRDEEVKVDAENMQFYQIFGSNQENEDTQATERDLHTEKSDFGASKFQSKYQLIKQQQQ